MDIKFTLDRFEGDYAILISKDNKVNWPKNLLPENLKEGESLYFNIENNEVATKNKKEKAKDLLNEILDVEE